MSLKNSGKLRKDTGVDETALFKRVKDGDKKAKEEIIKNYTGLVASIARKYQSCFKGMDMDELMAEGNHGLLEALNRYKASSKAKFSTYAWFWIMKNIHQYINTSIAIINVPQAVLSKLKKITSGIETEIKKGNEPSLEEISGRLDMDLGNVRELLGDRKNLSNPLSLSGYIDQGDQDITLEDTVSDKSSSIRDILEKKQESSELNLLLDQLGPLEAQVIKLRHGFIENKYHNLKETGQKLAISPSRVKDIEVSAIMKLKRLIQSSGE